MKSKVETTTIKCPTCGRHRVVVVERIFATCKSPICPYTERYDPKKHTIQQELNLGLDS